MTTRRVHRQCRSCGATQPDRYGIPDPCLGLLPGVTNTCCGHGARRQCYVVVVKRDGSGTYALRGDRARAKLILLGGSPPPFLTDEHPSPYGPMPGWLAT